MPRSKNSTRYMVEHFIPKGALRPPHLRQKKKKRSTSNFVRYFNSLQERGPFTPSSLYEQWTKKIRTDMEEAGTWPTGEQVASIEVVAEYLSRLQREFWDTNKPLDPWTVCPYTQQELLVPNSRWTFRRIYEKIRRKVMSDKTFRTSPYWGQRTPISAEIVSYDWRTRPQQQMFIDPWGLKAPKDYRRIIYVPYAASFRW